MANYTQSGIQFTEFNTSKMAFPTIISDQVVDASQEDLNNYYRDGVEGEGMPTTIDVLSIDWNGAELGTVNGIDLGTINTTGDLLNAIKALANANKYTA